MPDDVPEWIGGYILTQTMHRKDVPARIEGQAPTGVLKHGREYHFKALFFILDIFLKIR